MKKQIIAALALLTLALSQTTSSYASNISGHDIVLESTTYPSYAKNYSNVDLLLEDTDFIIYGKVTAADSFGESGLIWTDVTVEVIDPMESAFSAGDLLHVYQQKGELTVNEFIQSFDEPMRQQWEENFADYTENEKNTKFMRQTNGTPISAVGDESVYCLTTSAWSTSEKTVFDCVGSYCGEYKKIGSDLFAVIPPRSNNKTVLKNTGPSGYTLDELKDMLHK